MKAQHKEEARKVTQTDRQTDRERETQRCRAGGRHAEAAGSDVLLEDTPVAGREGDGGAELPAPREADASVRS